MKILAILLLSTSLLAQMGPVPNCIPDPGNDCTIDDGCNKGSCGPHVNLMEVTATSRFVLMHGIK